MRLHAEAAGQGTDLVLVHGWGMNASVMTGLAGTLVDRFRVTLVELPGHGRSPWDPGWNDLDRWAEACLAVAPARAIWIGWSLGGLVSLAATLAAPERAAGLVQIASSPRFVRADDWPPGVVAETFEQFAASLIAEPAGSASFGRAARRGAGASAPQSCRSLCRAQYPAVQRSAAQAAAAGGA
jgi:pimeloyl-[acyl-carrier protein] methyl ester esterase